MGLLSTGDEYNRRGDKALEGLNNVEKVVDDILVHSPTFRQHVETVVNLLRRCREYHITLNPVKFQFAQQSVNYVGYKIGTNGIQADPNKVSAIADFPIPTDLTRLRSFFGLINQLGSFSKEISRAAEPLRPLLKKSNNFQWTASHTKAFEDVKEALCQPPILTPFDPSMPLELHTDASRNGGLGFALLQLCPDGTRRLIQCGSRFLTDAESRYAMVELELLGVVWAVRKCRLYLMGLQHFDIIVDHQPLVPILNEKTMDAIENPRIMRLKERLLGYSFSAKWQKGKDHNIPDALSRAPVCDPTSEDFECEKDLKALMCAHIQELTTHFGLEHDAQSDPALIQLTEASKADPEYQDLIRYALGDRNIDVRSSLPHLIPFQKLKDELSVEDGLVLYKSRIVVPKTERKRILARLHDSHQGIERTKRRARQTVFWPGLTSDIKNTIGACSACQSDRPSLPAEPKHTDPVPSYPFEEVGVDLFHYAGKQYIAYVDRLSGWLEVVDLGSRNVNTESVIKALRRIFSSFGVPRKLRSDGGPQFSSAQFQDFLKTWGISHGMSAPKYPQSNGLAEAAVKVLKHLLATATQNGNLNSDEFHRGLIELRNTPRANGRSPSEIVFGHSMRSCIPVYRSKNTVSSEVGTSVKKQEANARSLPQIPIQEEVWLQDRETGRWNTTGVVIKASGRNYLLQLPNGRVLWRNRRHIRPRMQMKKRVRFQDEVEVCPNETPPLRRSPRQKKET